MQRIRAFHFRFFTPRRRRPTVIFHLGRGSSFFSPALLEPRPLQPSPTSMSFKIPKRRPLSRVPYYPWGPTTQSDLASPRSSPTRVTSGCHPLGRCLSPTSGGRSHGVSVNRPERRAFASMPGKRCPCFAPGGSALTAKYRTEEAQHLHPPRPSYCRRSGPVSPLRETLGSVAIGSPRRWKMRRGRSRCLTVKIG